MLLIARRSVLLVVFSVVLVAVMLAPIHTIFPDDVCSSVDEIPGAGNDVPAIVWTDPSLFHPALWTRSAVAWRVVILYGLQHIPA